MIDRWRDVKTDLPPDDGTPFEIEFNSKENRVIRLLRGKFFVGWEDIFGNEVNFDEVTRWRFCNKSNAAGIWNPNMNEVPTDTFVLTWSSEHIAPEVRKFQRGDDFKYYHHWAYLYAPERSE